MSDHNTVVSDTIAARINALNTTFTKSGVEVTVEQPTPEEADTMSKYGMHSLKIGVVLPVRVYVTWDETDLKNDNLEAFATALVNNAARCLPLTIADFGQRLAKQIERYLEAEKA